MRIADTLIMATPPLREAARGEDVIAFFSTYPQASLCPVVDTDNTLLGCVSRVQFQNRVATPYGRPLIERKSVLDLFEPKCRALSQDASLASMFTDDAFTDAHHLQDGFAIVDDAGRYVGVISGIGVLAALNEFTNGLVTSLKTEVEERRQAEDRVRRLAETDPLTGLANRRVFLRNMDNALQRQGDIACVFIDLDRFKTLNDQYGHAAGDTVLIEIAARLNSFPHGLYPSRFGGDEFALLLDLSNGDPAIPQLEHLLDNLTRPIDCGLAMVTVGASIGWSAFPSDGTTPSQLVHGADKAMLRIKSQGGGVTRFDAIQDFTDSHQSLLETELRAGVFKDAIKPAFQPVLNLRSRSIIGHEVLARWPGSPIRPEPQPSVFIPVAEGAGLIDPLFWSIARQAFSTATDLPGFLALNVSPSQLGSPVFAKTLGHMLADFGLPGDRLELEITENVLMRNGDSVVRNLNSLRDMGVRICLDDFGTGYSSLAMLTQLPLDKVKIDRCFVTGSADAGSKGEDQILEATIALCQQLGFTTCAEGVEDKETLERLAALGCDLAQGYHIGAPTFKRRDTQHPARMASALH